MAWSLDWFAAEKLGQAGTKVRRVDWTDQWIVVQGAFWLLILESSSSSRVVTATDFGSDEFNARDWTDQPFDADPCAAVADYNVSPPVYGAWTPAPIFTPPPPPGFPDS